ncbi:MAG: HNH endonuclease [Chloroflexota bacterium]|nr:HNH endonuclease [Chloroflexota bacterium]
MEQAGPPLRQPLLRLGESPQGCLQLDHRIPRIRGGDDGVLNRIALCANCNARKGAKAWGRFLDEERAKLPHERV